jgi:hypothetical protein
MKKLFIIAFLFMSSLSYAGIYGNIEIGQPIFDSYYYTNESEKQDYSNTYFTNLTLGYKNYFFNLIEYRIYSGIFTWSDGCIGKYEGKPFENIYGFGAKLLFKGFYFRYNHFCAHPVIHRKGQNTYQISTENAVIQYSTYDYNFDNKSWSSSITSITIGYEFEIN